METFVGILAIVLGALAIVGSIAPALPGPPLGWLGIGLVVSLLDYVVPAWFTKLTGGSKYGSWGAIAGLFLGLLYPPVGMIFGSLLGALLFELFFAGKGASDSVKSAFGAFLGFIFGTGLKLITSAVMLFYIVIYAF